MGTKKNPQKLQKNFSCWKNSTKKFKSAGLMNKNCLKGYFDLSSKTYREFLF